MRTTMVMPVALLLVGAASCFAIRRRERPAELDQAVPAASSESAQAPA
jgi:hypothetical protein